MIQPIMHQLREGKYFANSIEEALDNAIERWRNGSKDWFMGEESNNKPTLQEYLGMDDLEYKTFTESPDSFISAVKNKYKPQRK